MIHPLALCFIVYGAFLAGVATTLFYVIKRRRVIVVPPAPPWRPPTPYRSELPTLTDLRVDRTIGELARKCRQENAQ